MREIKKGFTLVELLAVIVILAIVALITTPIVLKIINVARKGAFTRTAEMVLKASKSYYLEKQVNMEPIEDVIFTCNNKECLSQNKNLNIHGSMGNGTVIIRDNGDVSFALSNDTYCAVKYESSKKINIKKGNCSDIDITNDTTQPIIKNVSTNTTTNSITIVVSAEDNESGIHHYAYSIDGGLTYVEDTSNLKIYEGLEKKEYQIKVRVYNGTYGKETYTEENGMSESETITVTLDELERPNITISPEGWAKEKEVKIDYYGASIQQYSLDNGVTYKTYVKPFLINDNVLIIADAFDGTNSAQSQYQVLKIDNEKPTVEVSGINTNYSTKDEINIIFTDSGSGVTYYCVTNTNNSDNCNWIEGKASAKYEINSNGIYYAFSKDLVGNISEGKEFTIDKIDTESPTASLEVTGTTTNSITVKATCTDNIGIVKYEYSYNNGVDFIEGTTDIYTFKDLTTGTYNLKVRCYDEARNNGEASVVGTTENLEDISYSVSNSGVWSISKTVTITYPKEEYVKEYLIISGTATKEDGTQLDIDTWYQTSNKNEKVIFTSNGKMTSRISDGNNTKYKDLHISMIDTTAPVATVVYKTADGQVYESDNWTNQSVTAYLSAIDNESGLDHYQMTYEGATWIDIAGDTFTFENSGRTGMWFRAVDKVGNIGGQTTTYLISIDKTNPTITYNYNAVSDQGGYGGAYYMGCFNGEIIPTLTLSDTGGSGLSDNNQILVWKDDTWPNNAVSIGNNQWNIPMTTEGRYIPHVIARDNAGNVSQGTRTDGNHLTVWDIDTSTPTMSVNLNGYTPGSWTNGSVAIALIGSNGGCDTGKYYWYSINDGDWVHFGTGDVATYNITNDANYNIKFLITDGFGRWGTQTQNYSIKIDKTGPTYTSVEVKNVTSSGYDIYMYGVNDTLSGVNRVQFPTWIDGQAVRDGWETGSFASGINEGNGTWHYRVNTSDYNNQSGTYITHIYLWDNVGNVSALNTNTANNVVNVPSACNKDDNGNCITNTTYKTGDAITLGGYNWHVIGDTGTNLTLLMDADMGGSHNSSGSAYSWDTSTIRTNLNGTFLTDLESKITNEIVSTPICADPSRIGRETFGGYLMSEIAALTPTFDIYGNLITRCTQVVTDKVRLITISEYWHMSPYYTSVESNYPNVENITRISRNSDYASWLYCNSSTCGSSNGWWWTMGSSNNNSSSRYAYYVHNYGVLYTSTASSNMGVRPVITIVK